MSWEENIVYGVISALIATFLTFVWYVLWRKSIEPWIESRLYRSIVLEGAWSARGVRHFKQKIDGKKGGDVLHDELRLQLNITQSGYNLSGVFSATSILAGKEVEDRYENVYRIKGCVYDGYALIEYHPLSKKRSGLGALLLEVKEGGKVMEGSIIFVEEGDMEITSTNNVLFNREAEA